jgi:hypothetical protein
LSMADYRAIVGVVRPRPRVFKPVGRTKPDLDLIKQVEQVTTSAFDGPAWRFAAIPSVWITDVGRSPRVSDLAALAVIWLQKQPGDAEGDLSAKGQSGNPGGPIRRFDEPGYRAVALPNSARLIP